MDLDSKVNNVDFPALNTRMPVAINGYIIA